MHVPRWLGIQRFSEHAGPQRRHAGPPQGQRDGGLAWRAAAAAAAVTMSRTSWFPTPLVTVDSPWITDPTIGAYAITTSCLHTCTYLSACLHIHTHVPILQISDFTEKKVYFDV